MFVFLMFGTLALILFNCSQSLHLYLGYKEYFGMGIPGPDEIKSLYSVQNIGPSGVRALPLAAGINVVGHYKWHFFLFLSLSLSFFRAHC